MQVHKQLVSYQSINTIGQNNIVTWDGSCFFPSPTTASIYHSILSTILLLKKVSQASQRQTARYQLTCQIKTQVYQACQEESRPLQLRHIPSKRSSSPWITGSDLPACRSGLRKEPVQGWWLLFFSMVRIERSSDLLRAWAIDVDLFGCPVAWIERLMGVDGKCIVIVVHTSAFVDSSGSWGLVGCQLKKRTSHVTSNRRYLLLRTKEASHYVCGA